jgi:putative hydrolase of the HAD superfamily
MKIIRAIIFDYGRVISTDQDISAVNEMCSILKVPYKIFKPLYLKFRLDYDAALLTAGEFWQNICDQCHIPYSKNMINNLIQLDVKSWTSLNKETLDYILGLKRYRVKKAVISNIPVEIVKYINDKFPWFDIFDVVVYSCDLKLCKPDKVIYYKCLELLQVPPGECIFIDDSYENIRSAGEIGINTIQFINYKQCKEEIEKNYTYM